MTAGDMASLFDWMSLRLQALEELRVRHVLRATGGALVSDQVLSGDHPHGHVVERGLIYHVAR